jgi:hypothetical protein
MLFVGCEFFWFFCSSYLYVSVLCASALECLIYPFCYFRQQSALTQPQMMIVHDIDDVFVPISEGLAVDPVASK